MKPKPLEVLESQHSCFCYEDDGLTVTVYHKNKKSMRRYEVNTALDLAKAHLMDKIQGKI